MATLKACASAVGAGFISLSSRVNYSNLLKCNRIFGKTQVRHASYQCSPEVGDDSLYTKYEISRDANEWKFVEALFPRPTILKPSPKAEYPSGWRPPQAPSPDAPYYVRRAVSHMLPVYLNRRGPRDLAQTTQIRRVEGDIWVLESELKAYLQSIYPKQIIATHVNEVAGQIHIRGDFVNASKNFLLSKGM